MTPEERAEAILRSCTKDDDGQPIVERWRLVETIRAAVAEEREACAKIVHVARQYSVTQLANDALADVEQAIRARG